MSLSIFIELSAPLEIIKMATWNDTEVLQLISLWGEEGVQEQLEGSKRNKHVYTKISLALAKKNINKDCSQCQAKIKKLKLDYRKAKDKNGKTGRGRTMWKYFEALDPILGNKPASKPPVVIDTSGPEKVVEDETENSEDDDDSESTSDLSGRSQTSSSSSSSSTSSSSLSTGTTEDELEQPAKNASTGIKEKDVKKPGDKQEQPATNVTTGIKGKPIKKTKEDRMEMAMTAVVKEVVDSQQKSDKMFLELEEKRMKFEAEQKKEEREFQMKMMTMLYGRPNPQPLPHTPPPGAYDPYRQYSNNSY